MKEPKVIETIEAGVTYKIPSYTVTNEGIVDAEPVEVKFCKGDKSDETKFRQTGVFTESILQAAKEYLESVNKEALASRETSMAITKIDEALMWLAKRGEDRRIRNVQQTYKA